MKGSEYRQLEIDQKPQIVRCHNQPAQTERRILGTIVNEFRQFGTYGANGINHQ